MILKSQMNKKHNNCAVYSVQEYKSKTHFIKTWSTVITVQYMLYKYNVQVDTDNVYLLCTGMRLQRRQCQIISYTTEVGDYFYIMKTTFHFNFNLQG